MTGDEGFNAQTDKYEDLVQAGVIDPTKVVRSALQNAASIASLLLTTEALVSEIPEDKKEAPMPAAAAAWAACTDGRDQGGQVEWVRQKAARRHRKTKSPVGHVRRALFFSGRPTRALSYLHDLASPSAA